MNIVVTGASSGVGYEAALQLAKNSGKKLWHLHGLMTSCNSYWKLPLRLTRMQFVYRLHFDIIHGDYDDVLLPFLKSIWEMVDI